LSRLDPRAVSGRDQHCLRHVDAGPGQVDLANLDAVKPRAAQVGIS
jgi:hypothetical protein